MKIVDDQSCFFQGFSFKILCESSLHFMGVRVFIIECMRNAKSQFQPNKSFWRLELATRTSREFESRANCLASLEVLSCSAPAGVTLQLPCMLHTCATFSDSPITRFSHEAFLKCTPLSFSLHSLTHYPYMIPT